RVADEIADQLRLLILTGQYRAGERLPPGRELARTLGVNRASLREALKKLEHLGLVRIRQGDGTRVENFMETAGIELVRYLVPLAPASFPGIIRDTLELRQLVARGVAGMAAERRRPEDLARLREIAARAEAAGLSHAELYELDFDFYAALAAAAQNRVIGLLINTVRASVSDYVHILAPVIVSPAVVCHHHARVLAALEARDRSAAIAAVDEYMARGSEHVLRLVDGGQLSVING
ncbi:MAG TPA: GntR family transcriptional regulator, partial [Kofleriaceae bacterium]|nr:GntR family transcriptional regulator [Kofleriaceae bacterium]